MNQNLYLQSGSKFTFSVTSECRCVPHYHCHYCYHYDCPL